MINVKVLGSLGKTLGKNSFTFNDNSMILNVLLRKIFNVEERNGDYSEILNDIIVAINGAAIPIKNNESVLKSGDEVTLIPISHGG